MNINHDVLYVIGFIAVACAFFVIWLINTPDDENNSSDLKEKHTNKAAKQAI